VLLPFAAALAEADAALAPRLTEDALAPIVAAIPDAWLAGGEPAPDAIQRMYMEYLSSRLRSRNIFVEEAMRARSHL
jgi:hypothetical protein